MTSFQTILAVSKITEAVVLLAIVFTLLSAFAGDYEIPPSARPKASPADRVVSAGGDGKRRRAMIERRGRIGAGRRIRDKTRQTNSGA